MNGYTPTKQDEQQLQQRIDQEHQMQQQYNDQHFFDSSLPFIFAFIGFVIWLITQLNKGDK